MIQDDFGSDYIAGPYARLGAAAQAMEQAAADAKAVGVDPNAAAQEARKVVVKALDQGVPAGAAAVIARGSLITAPPAAQAAADQVAAQFPPPPETGLPMGLILGAGALGVGLIAFLAMRKKRQPLAGYSRRVRTKRRRSSRRR